MPKEKKSVSNPPISFRVPAPLRARLRRFADRRSLGEAEALRLVLAEYLNEIDERAELAGAERWQVAQTVESHRRSLSGENPIVPWEAVDALLRAAASSGERGD